MRILKRLNRWSLFLDRGRSGREAADARPRGESEGLASGADAGVAYRGPRSSGRAARISEIKSRRKVGAFSPRSPQQTDLTILVPTINRPAYCAAQLRFFRDCGVRHQIVVADSSRPAEAKAVQDACVGIAEYWAHDLPFCDKLLAAVSRIDTPFVALAPDDDIAFPHAIDEALDFLVGNPDYVVAQGYTLRFGIKDNDFDIHSVFTYVPSITQTDPLERHYNLMRRYQPFIWAVIRRDVLLSALQAVQVHVTTLTPLFQELMFMSVAILQGKIAMLPIIYAMRGMEESTVPITRSHPLFSFLDNAQAFFQDYLSYRDYLLDFIREKLFISDAPQYPSAVSLSSASTLKQLIDMAHATWLGREVDAGMLNHATERLLGLPKPVLRGDPVWPGWRKIAKGDRTNIGPSGRRYIWRRAVLAAEPSDEIIISRQEISRVEQELEMYWLNA